MVDWNLTHSKLLSHLSSTQEWGLFQYLKHIFINFEWHEFTDLFEIQYADFKIFIFQNKFGIFCKISCFKNNLLYGIVLQQTFATYGIPDEPSSDGGPKYITHHFYLNGEFHHRLSSVAFPHSNCRVEVGNKTIKRLITDNVGRECSLVVDKFQRAILQYQNTPDRGTKLSLQVYIWKA